MSDRAGAGVTVPERPAGVPEWAVWCPTCAHWASVKWCRHDKSGTYVSGLQPDEVSHQSGPDLLAKEPS